ncbi:MAG: efflux RND transporter periplasmic adaptor subunit [Halanaerobiaceae bacterium]
MVNKKVLFLGAIIILYFILLSGCGLLPEENVQQEPELVEPPEPNIAKEVVKKGTMTEEITGLSRVAAAEEADLYFTRSGRVSELYVERNQEVEEGERLAELELGDLEFEYELAKIDLEKARLNKERKEKLVGVELSEYDWKIEKLDYKKINMRVERMEQTIAESTIDAPFTGRIISLSTSETDQVGEYEDIITLADTSELILHMEVDKDELRQVTPKLDAKVELERGFWIDADVVDVPSSNAEISPGEPDRRIRIQLTDPQKAAEELGVSEEELLTYNSLEQTRIILQEKEDILFLPKGAVREYGDRTFVRVIDENGVRREIDVELGLESGNKVEIVDGLKEGDEVIAR